MMKRRLERGVVLLVCWMLAGTVYAQTLLSDVIVQAQAIEEKEDDAEPKIIALFEAKAREAEQAGNRLEEAVYYSLLAQAVWQYREGEKDYERIVSLIRKSRLDVSPALALKDQTSRYEPVLEQISSDNFSYRPDLITVLYYRAWRLLAQLPQRFPAMQAELYLECEKTAELIRRYAQQPAAEADLEIRLLQFKLEQEKIERAQYEEGLLRLADLYLTAGGGVCGDIYYLLALSVQDKSPLQAKVWAEKARQYGGSWGAAQAAALLKNLERPVLTLSTEAVHLPQQPVKVTFHAKNCTRFEYRFYKIGNDQMRAFLPAQNLRQSLRQWIQNRPQADWRTASLPETTRQPLVFHKGEIALPALEKGRYIMESRIAEGTESDFSLLQVSDLLYFCFPLNGKTEQWEGYSLERTGGAALKDVSIELFHAEYDIRSRKPVLERRAAIYGDKNGRFVLDNSLAEKNNWRYEIFLCLSRKDDTLWSGNDIYLSHTARQHTTRKEEWMRVDRICFFNNLPVYRRGDSVKLVLLTTVKEGDSVFACPSGTKRYPQRIRLSLKDPSLQSVQKFTVPIGEKGLARLDFALPDNAKAGTWRLQADDFSAAVCLPVENYRRPSFEIVWEQTPLKPVRGEYLLQAQARYLSGEPLCEAEVNVCIGIDNVTGLGRQTLRTGRDGRFQIRFTPDSLDLPRLYRYDYRVEASVCDAGGETQVSSVFIPRTLYYDLSCEKPGFWVLSAPEAARCKPIRFSVSGLNSDQKWSDLQARIACFRRNPDNDSAHPLPVALPDDLQKKFALTGEFSLPDKWPSGFYELAVTATAPDGTPLSLHERLTAVKPGEKIAVKEPRSDLFLVYPIETDLKRNKLVVLAGNPFSKPLLTRFRIEDINGNTVEKEVKNAPGFHTVSIDIKDLNPHQDWSVSMFAAARNLCWIKSVPVAVPKPDKRLVLHAEGFAQADSSGILKAEAGSRQQAAFFLEAPQNNTSCAKAQMMVVSIYDQSLESFSSRNLSWENFLQPAFKTPHGTAWDRGQTGLNNRVFLLSAYPLANPAPAYPAFAFDLSWKGFPTYRVMQRFAAGSAPLTAAAPEADNLEAETVQTPEPENNFTPRENFQPEVYFTLLEPQGDTARFSFAWPDYFGRFKMRAFACTDRLFSGYAEQCVEVQKDLMLASLSPRFVRKGDSAVWVCRYRLTEKAWDEYEPYAQTGVLRLNFMAQMEVTHQDGRAEKLFPVLQDLVLTAPQGAMEVPLKTADDWKIIRISYLAVLTDDTRHVLLKDALTETVPVEEDLTAVKRYETFAVGEKQKFRLNASFPKDFDSVRLRLNTSSAHAVRTLLAEKQYDSCKDAFLAVQKMTALYFAGGEWRSYWPVLQKFFNGKNGFSWIKDGEASYFATLYVLETLAQIPFSELKNLNGFSRICYRCAQYMEGFLPASDMLRFLDLCILLPDFKRGCTMEDSLHAYCRRIFDNRSRLSLAQQAVLLRGLIHFGKEDDIVQARTLLQNFNRLALYSPSQGMYWKREALGTNPGERMDAMSAMIEAYTAASGHAELKKETNEKQISQMLMWFSANAQSLDFGRSAACFAGTRQLTHWASAVQQAEKVLTPAAQSPAQAKMLDSVLHVKPADLEKTVSGAVASLGPAPCIYGTLCAYSTQHTREVQAYPGSGELMVTRTYRNLTSPFEDRYQKGDIVEVTLEVNAGRDFSYVHLKAPRPAGLEWVSTQGGYNFQNGLYFYKDIDDVNADYLMEFLSKGRYTLTYRLKAQNGGVFSDAPAVIESENLSGYGSNTAAGQAFIR